MSKYEEKIVEILKKEHIKFEREKTYIDLRRATLRFDFYIPSLNCLIEVDGEQHFYQVSKYQKTRQIFLKQLEHDRIKNSYCLAHNIRLYRIPYWDIKKIKKFNDMLKDSYLVTTKWHNDLLRDGVKYGNTTNHL